MKETISDLWRGEIHPMEQRTENDDEESELYDVIDGYYDNMLRMLEVSIEQQFITRDCTELYQISSTVEETLDYIENYDPTEYDISSVKIR